MPPGHIPPFDPDALFPPPPQLRTAVAEVCDREPPLRRIEREVGPLLIRSWPPGFPSLIRIILGQQLSSRAAGAIFQRLHQQMTITPENIGAASGVMLQQVGLSRTKIVTCQRLSAAIAAGEIDLEKLSLLTDSEVIDQLTQIKGIGAWTAEVYLLFCLKRLSSFPASDLAVQIGIQLVKNLEHRPTRKALMAMTDHLNPYRGAVAHLSWHYYRHRVRK